jgi:hypothetical protein
MLPPYKNTIDKTNECYVLSVITCFTPFFVNYTFISVNCEKIKVAIGSQCKVPENIGKVVIAC